MEQSVLAGTGTPPGTCLPTSPKTLRAIAGKERRKTKLQCRVHADKLELENSRRVSQLHQLHRLSVSHVGDILKHQAKLASRQQGRNSTVLDLSAVLKQHDGGAVLFHHEKGEGRAVVYHLQGDASWHTEEAVQARAALRNHPAILGWLHKFYNTFPSARRHGYIKKEDYILFNVNVMKALFLPGEWDPVRAREMAEDDWLRDLGNGFATMHKAEFYDSLFEVAALCTRSRHPFCC
jgi:hypothetical protein